MMTCYRGFKEPGRREEESWRRIEGIIRVLKLGKKEVELKEN